MSLLEAVVLGLVQGITEFLPISSTAHLRIAPELFGWGDPGAAYSAIIQLGTVAAVIIYFIRDLGRLTLAWGRSIASRSPFATPESRLAWFVILGTIPVAVLGLAFKKVIEHQFRSLYIIATMMILLALVLWYFERRASHRRTLDEMTVRDGVTIGLWQCLALVPGSSRSGSTLAGGLSLGFNREAAMRYSFLLSIPATTAAGLLELRHVLHAKDAPSTAAMVVGTLVSFLSGMAAIGWLLRYLRTRTTAVFIVYRLILGTVLFILLFAHVLQPQSGIENISNENPPTKQDVRKQVTD